MLKNWKTTAAGVASILTGLGLIGGGIKSALDGNITMEPFIAGVSAIAAGIGLIAAKDHNVTGGTAPASPPAS